MNCRPGDLAYIIGASEYAGMIVEVLHAAPARREFRLPDGMIHEAIPFDLPFWVFRSAGTPFRCPMVVGGFRSSIYGAGPDSRLRPIRDPGEDATDEIILRIGKPTTEGQPEEAHS